MGGAGGGGGGARDGDERGSTAERFIEGVGRKMSGMAKAGVG